MFSSPGRTSFLKLEHWLVSCQACLFAVMEARSFALILWIERFAKLFPWSYLSMADILIPLVCNVCTIVRRQKDSSASACFAGESMVRSRGRGVELAHTKGIVYRNYHKYSHI